MLYGNYCYIIIENFPKKFSPCIDGHMYVDIQLPQRLLGTINVNFCCDVENFETKFQKQRSSTALLIDNKFENLFELINFFILFNEKIFYSYSLNLFIYFIDLVPFELAIHCLRKMIPSIRYIYLTSTRWCSGQRHGLQIGRYRAYDQRLIS